IGLTTTLKNAWTTSRQVNFFWVANFNLKFGIGLAFEKAGNICLGLLTKVKESDRIVKYV
ncbi:hypothetical protein ACRE2A_06145, partial [Streptococcus pneumoniae]